MDLSLSPEHLAVKQVAADFVDRDILPNAAAWDRAESVDLGIVKRLGQLGFLGQTIPDEYGGSGGDHIAYCLVLEELGRGDSSVRGILSVSLGLVGKSIDSYGTDEQKRAWLPGICSGDLIACFGLTEPGTGSDAGSLITRAVRDGDDWLITGNKIFITNGTWADVALIFA